MTTKVTIEVREDHGYSKSWEGYPESLKERGFFAGAEVIQALVAELKEREAREAEEKAAAEAEAKRERFTINWPDYCSLGLMYSNAVLNFLGNPLHTPSDAWYEVLNPEELGLTSYTPVVKHEDGDRLAYHEVREGMEVEVTERWGEGDRLRTTRGKVTEIREGGTTALVGGYRVQLAYRNDSAVEIIYTGEAA